MRSREKPFGGLERPVVALVLLASAIGCGDGSGGGGSAGTANVRAMTDFYAAYLSEHNHRPPPNEQAFRAYLESRQDRLERAGMTVDQMFVSPRGSGSLQWVYGNRVPTDERGTPYFAYETTSVAGKRLVLAPRGMTEMEETRFRRVFPNAP